MRWVWVPLFHFVLKSLNFGFNFGLSIGRFFCNFQLIFHVSFNFDNKKKVLSIMFACLEIQSVQQKHGVLIMLNDDTTSKIHF
jgi:hypothetical protein